MITVATSEETSTHSIIIGCHRDDCYILLKYPHHPLSSQYPFFLLVLIVVYNIKSSNVSLLPIVLW